MGADANCEDWSIATEQRYPSLSNGKAFAKQQLLLEKIIADNVIPRLLLALPNVVPQAIPASNAVAAKINDSVGEFAELVIKKDADAAIAYFDALRDQGATIEALFQDLLAPAARRLGELWEEDINDFMDVTRGISHLQHIVHAFSNQLVEEGRRPASDRRALLIPLPGEQHTFGVSLIGEHFRREGWRVWGGPPRSIDDVFELIEGQWFDIVGLSISAVADPSSVASNLRLIRRASRNKELKVLVGGRSFTLDPSLISEVGADATATDGRSALLQVTELIGSSPRT